MTKSNTIHGKCLSHIVAQWSLNFLKSLHVSKSKTISQNDNNNNDTDVQHCMHFAYGDGICPSFLPKLGLKRSIYHTLPLG